MQPIKNPDLLNLPDIPEGYSVFLSDLSEIPHGKLTNVKPDGKNGPIYFYDTQDLKALAFNEDKGCWDWADVSCFSIHPKRRLVIVTLSNGLQIFTDDDPRAIYGLNKNTGKYERHTPEEAKELDINIPVCSVLAEHKYSKDEFIFPLFFDDFNEIRDVQKEFYRVGIITLVSYDKELKQFVLETDDNYDFANWINKPGLEFATIDLIEDTGVYLDGYDLTVPGYETFINYSGVVLSNTMNVHVPALPEAQAEIKEKLLPSKQIFSPRDYRVVNKLKQDYILGPNSQITAPAENRWILNSAKELMEGLNSGKIKLSDEIVILDK